MTNSWRRFLTLLSISLPAQFHSLPSLSPSSGSLHFHHHTLHPYSFSPLAPSTHFILLIFQIHAWIKKKDGSSMSLVSCITRWMNAGSVRGERKSRKEIWRAGRRVELMWYSFWIWALSLLFFHFRIQFSFLVALYFPFFLPLHYCRQRTWKEGRELSIRLTQTYLSDSRKRLERMEWQHVSEWVILHGLCLCPSWVKDQDLEREGERERKKVVDAVAWWWLELQK